MNKEYGFHDFILTTNELYPHMVSFQVISSILQVANQLLLLTFLGKIINVLITTTMNEIVLIIVVFLSLTLFLRVVDNLVNVQIEKGKQMLNIRAEANLAERLNNVNYKTHIDDDFRKLYSAVKTGFEYTGGFDIFVSNIINNMTKFTTTLVISGGLMVKIFSSPSYGTTLNFFYELFIFCLLLIPIISSIFLAKQEGKVMEKFFAYNMKFNRALDYYSGILFKEPKYAKFLKIYDPQNKITNQAGKIITDQVNEDERYQLKAAVLGNAGSIVTSLVIGILYCLFSIRVLDGSLLLGTMVTSVGYLQILIGSLGQFFSAWSNRKAAFTTMSQYIKFMNFKLTNVNTPEEIEFDGVIKKIEFKHVYFRFSNDEDYILTDVNFVIENGERIAIVGPNGSGKSTLIKLLLRLYQPSQGQILINDISIEHYELGQYQKQFSTVFQDFNIFAWSIKENIVMEQAFDEQRLLKILKLVGLEKRIKTLSKGVNTPATTELDESGVELSGGERQKIAIARALYRNSQVVILDEPTASLDPIAEANVFSNFNGLVQNKTAIFISHRMSATQFSNRILVMADGKLIASGNHQQLMKERGLYYDMYQKQAQYYDD
ncbi:ABC transporter ATP-binding protein [Weissella paramesenteroides]|uniref:ABC transporter ATP-binding protein n=1 Tax=Weissella paramesenteroides TaxID=1249 RepID=UPI003F747B8B